MSRISIEIPYVTMGILQARLDPDTRSAEQERIKESLATTRSAPIIPVFIDTLDPKGILQGQHPDSFFGQFDGLIATGTSDMDEFHRDISTSAGKRRAQYHNEVGPIINGARKREKPFLGVCFGSHALVVATIGEHAVEHAPEHEELATVTLKTTLAGQRDPLLAGLPREFDIYSGHKGSIIESQIPEGAIELLGSTDRTPISVFRITDTQGYGVQQHPEADDMYIKTVDETFEMMTGAGLKRYKRTGEFSSPYSEVRQIFGNFGEIVFQTSKQN